MIPIIPGEVTKVWLPEDEGKPEGERTLFYLAAVNYKIQRKMMRYMRQLLEVDKKRLAALKALNLPADATKEQIAEAMEQMSKTPEGQAALEVEVDLITTDFLDDTLGFPGEPVGLVGWERMKHPKTGAEIPFSKDHFREYLTLTQQVALARMVMDAQNLTRAEVKN